jgi:hypothetical protein
MVLVLQLAVLATLPNISVITKAALSLVSDCTVQAIFFCVTGLGEISSARLTGNDGGNLPSQGSDVCNSFLVEKFKRADLFGMNWLSLLRWFWTAFHSKRVLFLFS